MVIAERASGPEGQDRPKPITPYSSVELMGGGGCALLGSPPYNNNKARLK